MFILNGIETTSPNANDNNKVMLIMVMMMVELKMPPGVTAISRAASGCGAAAVREAGARGEGGGASR